VTLASGARARERERLEEEFLYCLSAGCVDLLPIAVSFSDFFFLVSSSEKVLNCNLVHCEVCLEEGHLLLGEETQ
jgi:hypothetical protein